jgi:hypothetical protein
MTYANLNDEKKPARRDGKEIALTAAATIESTIETI